MDVDQRSGIEIDGVGIDKIGLHELRKKICIVPQDPFIMEGSLKYNIDPMDEFSEEAVEQVLIQIGFYETMTEAAKNSGGSKPNPNSGVTQPLIKKNEIDHKLRCSILQSSNLSLGQK